MPFQLYWQPKKSTQSKIIITKNRSQLFHDVFSLINYLHVNMLWRIVMNHFLILTTFFFANPSKSPPPIPLIIFCISGLELISFIMFMRFPAPPNWAIIFGSIIDCSLPKTWLGFLIIFTLSFIPFPRLVWPTLFISPFNFLCSYNKIFTSSILVPEPLAILFSLLSSTIGASLSN